MVRILTICMSFVKTFGQTPYFVGITDCFSVVFTFFGLVLIILASSMASNVICMLHIILSRGCNIV